METYLLFIVFRKCNLGWDRGPRVDSQKQNDNLKKEKKNRNISSQSEIWKISLPNFSFFQLPSSFLYKRDYGISASQSCLLVVMPASQLKCLCVYVCVCVCVSHSFISESLCPRGLQPTRLLCPQNSPARILNCHSLLQGIFPRDQTWVSCIADGLFEQSGKPKIEVQFIYNTVLVSGI